MGIIDNVLRSKLYRFSRTSMTGEDLLVAYPRGAYTGMRTRNKVAVQSFTQHLERFSNSVSALYRDDANKSSDLREQIALMSKPELVRPLVSDLIIGGLKHYENDNCELRLLLLGYYDELRESMCLSVHFTPLAAWNPQQTCMVEVLGDPRASPKVKDSGWVKYRQRYIEQKSPQTDEVLLSRHVGDENRIYEGLSSNFFAVLKNNVVVTAPDDLVLVGTIRTLAIKACQAKTPKASGLAPL
jgi:branched-subunit amino acid aminotransferase/4-amino-4-deoxychorismate lyase